MNKIYYAWIPILATLLITSCVSLNRFTRISQKADQLEAEKIVTDEKLKSCISDREKMVIEATANNSELEKFRKDTLERGIYQRKIQQNYGILNDTYDKVLKNQDRIQSYSKDELSKREKELLASEQGLQESEKRINQLQSDVQTREQRVTQLEKVLSDKDEAVNSLKSKVSNALLGFKEKDLTVNIKNGKVYVSLSEQLLFKSGSIVVDPQGLEPLKKLAVALKDQDDISIMVEGHTDNVAFTKGNTCIKDNWDLSVLRATSVTKILTEEGVNPMKVIPSGRSEFSPLAEGNSPEARQKNRRTEIILTPKLDELFKILDAK
jgi:chemotaxis protein MotB